MDVKVWLGGDGASELGDRDRGGERVGALEALLRRIEPDGWLVAGATQWRHIPKYRVGAAIGRDSHGDHRNVRALVLTAFEAACEAVAFTRDVDAEPERAKVIAQAIEDAQALFPTVAIIGGCAHPALEGWILAMLGVRDTEAMSRMRCDALLADRDLAGKKAEDYVDVVDRAALDRLPPGCAALVDWIAQARTVLGQAIRGSSAGAAGAGGPAA